jgi:predicted Zn-dependent peptidase
MENVGGHLNAYTAREQTAYYAKVLKEDMPLAADIIGDILTHSTFAPEEMERERGVILQEIGQANDTPDDIVFDHFQATAYPDQPMGRPTLGTEASVSGMGREVLTEYMRRHYGPSRMVVAAAGALEHETLVGLVETHFADLPLVAPSPAEVARYGGGEFREERELDQVHVVLGFEADAVATPRHYPTMLLSTLLGGGMSSRLFQEIREKRGLVYSIYSFAQLFRDNGLFAVYAGTGEEQAAELVPVVLEELKRVQHDVTADELARAKAQLRASVLMSLESTGSRCEQLARQIQVHGRIIPVEETKAKIAAVTVEQVQEAAAAIFRSRPTLAALGPAGRVPGLPSIVEKLAA